LSRNEIWLLGAPDAEAALVPMRDGDWALIALEGAAPVAVWDHTRTMLSVNLSTAKPIAQLPGEATPRSLSRHLSLAIASDSIAGARAIAEQTVAYMKERQQFGRSIASFQALKHRVADLMTMIVSGEEFVSLATEAAAAGHADADIWANLAKVRATETYVQVSSDCLQLHGGVGFTWEFDVHLYLNRARLSEMLVAPNAALRDAAAEGFAAAFRAGQQPLELAL
jgi:alkylation response protein AidB-like acyl-CoA dehydrogenase